MEYGHVEDINACLHFLRLLLLIPPEIVMEHSMEGRKGNRERMKEEGMARGREGGREGQVGGKRKGRRDEWQRTAVSD